MFRLRYLPLVWAMLWRSRTRAWLTFASVAAAFLLFGLLCSAADFFTLGPRLAGASNLMVASRYSLAVQLPLGDRAAIEALPGVVEVVPLVFFPTWYRDPSSTIITDAVDVPGFFHHDPRLVADEAALTAMQQTRDGALVGRELAQRFGWKLGDRIPLQSRVPLKDGGRTWTFQVVGLWHLNEQRVGRLPALQAFVNYAYVDEARRFDRGTVNGYLVNVDQPAHADPVSAAIDALFANSAAPTRTQSEQAFKLNILRRIGDIGLIVGVILGAVLFTLLLVAGNTMAQAFRERIPELGVLKTLGYTDGAVALLFVAEATLLLAAGAACGLGLDALLIPQLFKLAFGAAAPMPLETLLTGTVTALAIAAAVALIPAWRASRLSVVEALAVA
ncbi:MAG: ABC transporter permease [Nevskia sp.]|nr:ABC transporter permease [Nevskia sp.]